MLILGMKNMFIKIWLWASVRTKDSLLSSRVNNIELDPDYKGQWFFKIFNLFGNK